MMVPAVTVEQPGSVRTRKPSSANTGLHHTFSPGLTVLGPQLLSVQRSQPLLGSGRT